MAKENGPPDFRHKIMLLSWQGLFFWAWGGAIPPAMMSDD
jgi:hypothetical protein